MPRIQETNPAIPPKTQTAAMLMSTSPPRKVPGNGPVALGSVGPGDGPRKIGGVRITTDPLTDLPVMVPNRPVNPFQALASSIDTAIKAQYGKTPDSGSILDDFR